MRGAAAADFAPGPPPDAILVCSLGRTGLEPVWALAPAVKAAIATGVVDPKRVGLHGHSWGGYQTAHTITQTDLFAAALFVLQLVDYLLQLGIDLLGLTFGGVHLGFELILLVSD